MIKFANLTDQMPYPAKHKGQLVQLHGGVVEYVLDHYVGTHRFRQSVVACINSLTYHVLSGDYIEWPWTNPLVEVDIVDDYECSEAIGQLYLRAKDISWNEIPEQAGSSKPATSSPTPTLTSSEVEKTASQPATPTRPITPVKSSSAPKSVPNVGIGALYSSSTNVPTPKSDLYLKPPGIPQFNVNKIWMSGDVDGSRLVIYNTLPEIPSRQNEISVTTDVERMTTRDLMKLFPNHCINTRGAELYKQVHGLGYDEKLGVLLPVEGFTEDEIRDNIVRYPHFYHLMRVVDDKLVGFCTHIEINGELFPTMDVWDSLPESKLIPRQADFIKDYVIRRYLLERDLRHVDHAYPLFGSLTPFLTLFMPPDDYIRIGYPEVESIVKQCVRSRVAFKQTRNPIIRRLRNV